MKKFIIALAAIFAVFGFTSCEKEPSKAIVGTWKATTVEMSIQGIKMEMDMAEMGGEMEFTFEKDGTGYARENFEGESVTSDMTYSIAGNMLTMTIEGDTESIPFTIDGNHMTWTMDGEFIGEEGMNVIIHFEKQ